LGRTGKEKWRKRRAKGNEPYHVMEGAEISVERERKKGEGGYVIDQMIKGEKGEVEKTGRRKK